MGEVDSSDLKWFAMEFRTTGTPTLPPPILRHFHIGLRVSSRTTNWLGMAVY